MLDIEFIRNNRKLVGEKSKQKGYPVDIDALIKLDDDRRSQMAKAEHLRRERNDLSAAAKGQKPTESVIAKGQDLKTQLAKVESELGKVENEYLNLLKQVPNMPLGDVPVGKSEADNQVVKEWGTKPELSFKPKTHGELGQAKGWIDKGRAANVAGSRFAYLTGDLVLLQFALVSWVLAEVCDQSVIETIIKANKLDLAPKPFKPVLPPFMLKTGIFDAMDRLEPRDDRYRVGEPDDDLWLQGSAEHVLGPMHMDEILPAAELPLRYIGYATSFRREAGTYGKDTEGIVRMHQFDKLEMESFTDAESGFLEHELFIAIQEHLMQQLKLPYRILNKCTYDIGKPNAHGVDIEVWMPGQDRFVETHTADYMTDYQARRLKTRYRSGDSTQFVHTNDGTAFALGRVMAAIIENYQTAEGNVNIPEALKPYMANKGRSA